MTLYWGGEGEHISDSLLGGERAHISDSLLGRGEGAH